MLKFIIIVAILDFLICRAIIRDMLAHYRIEQATKRRLEKEHDSWTSFSH